jgi:hypothetical protein
MVKRQHFEQQSLPGPAGGKRVSCGAMYMCMRACGRLHAAAMQPRARNIQPDSLQCIDHINRITNQLTYARARTCAASDKMDSPTQAFCVIFGCGAEQVLK